MKEGDNNNSYEQHQLDYLSGKSPLRAHWEGELQNRKLVRGISVPVAVVGATTVCATLVCVANQLINSD
jgi:hypothetical protein